MHRSEISMPVAKAISAITVATAAKVDVADSVARAAVQGASDATWYAVMSIPWGTIASIAAVLYTSLLICEWWWKKLWRPLAESRGWMKRRKRYILTQEEFNALPDSERGGL